MAQPRLDWAFEECKPANRKSSLPLPLYLILCFSIFLSRNSENKNNPLFLKCRFIFKSPPFVDFLKLPVFEDPTGFYAVDLLSAGTTPQGASICRHSVWSSSRFMCVYVCVCFALLLLFKSYPYRLYINMLFFPIIKTSRRYARQERKSRDCSMLTGGIYLRGSGRMRMCWQSLQDCTWSLIPG